MGRKSEKPEGAVQVQWWADPELLDWLDREAERMERSRGWTIQHAVRMWRKRLERERAKRGNQ